MAEMKLVNAEQLDADFTAIASAIRGKNGSTEKYAPGDMAAAISAIQTGGGGGAAKDYVKFYDYEGTLLHSYSKDEVEALTELPPLPSHDGLICQGWNWSLEDIKAEGKETNVGAMYITDDGKTRLYITIAAEERMDVPLCFLQTVANGVTIDWGDGSATETLSSIGEIATVHSYTSIGDYIITLDVVDGCTLQLGKGSYNYGIVGAATYSGSVYGDMIRKVEIGDATYIRDYALVYCYHLTSITIPKSATRLGANTFYDCDSLTGLTIPNGVTSIGSNFVSNCNALTSIAIPKSVSSVDTNAFNACTILTRITIPNSVKTVSTRMYSNCRSLTSIQISDGTRSIGDYAFDGCYTLASVTIPDSVTSIGISAFNGCLSLTNIAIPDSVTSIGNTAFANCNSLSSIVIPNGVTSISDGTFRDCACLTRITIPDGVTSIGKSAFQSCKTLTSIAIPDGVTSISDSAFNYCRALVSIIIPGSVTSIGNNAFYMCLAMKFYDFTKHTAVPTLANANAFQNIPSDCEIRVPAALYDEWIAATNWSTYAANIVAK